MHKICKVKRHIFTRLGVEGQAEQCRSLVRLAGSSRATLVHRAGAEDSNSSGPVERNPGKS